MSDRAQRVLDALMDFEDDNRFEYPISAIRKFFDSATIESINEDYEALTAEEEKQVIEAFLKFAY